MTNPPRDVMISNAAEETGYGWSFGLHEALDQAGALVGPLLLALLLAERKSYPLAFLALAVPAPLTQRGKTCEIRSPRAPWTSACSTAKAGKENDSEIKIR